eukprot:Lankesteria_metandrocarpae@DN2413_c0_g1_i1.p1
MHIKQISLRGFKTYKDHTVLNFVPGCNIIVGRNGSGKSNLLTAIQFVMHNDGSRHSSARARSSGTASFLHEGASSQVLNAWVEVILDNTDRRLKFIDKDEVTVRRRFGASKDEFLLDNKHVTKTEFVGVLESAGFSRANPYHVVLQGRVHELTTMSDNTRLSLLKDIAGTKVYDERRLEALATLEATKEREIEVDDTLRLTTERVTDLQTEQEELKEYQEVERKRRFTEAHLTDKQWNNMSREMQSFEKSFLSATSRLAALNAEMATAADGSTRAAEDRKQLALRIEQLNRQRNVLKDTELLCQEDLTKGELYLKDKAEQRISELDSYSKLQQKLVKIREEQKKVQSDIDVELRPRADQRKEETESISRVLEQLTEEITQLYAKMSRGKQYNTIKERNSALKAEIKSLETKMVSLQNETQECSAELKSLEAKIETDSRVRRETEIERQSLDNAAAALAQEQHELSGKYSGMDHEGHSRQELRAMDDQIKKLRSEIDHYAQAVSRTMRISQYRANKAAADWAAAAGRPESVKGSLLDNIRVDPRYHSAVEVSAGGQIFNLLVDNSDTAAGIIEHLKQHKIGGTTLTPLRDIKQASPKYPSERELEDKAAPLVNFIEFDEAVRPAVNQVFGKFLLVHDKDTGNRYRNFGFDCVTPNGEKVTRKGILSGGSTANLTRLKNATLLRGAEAELNAKLTQAEAIHQAQCKNADERKVIQTRIETLGRDLNRNANRQSQLIDSKLAHETEYERWLTATERLRDRRKELTESTDRLKTSIQRLRSEILTETLGDLTGDETNRLSEAEAAARSSKVQLTISEKKSRSVQTALFAAETRLKKDIRPMAQDVERELHKHKLTLSTSMLHPSDDDAARKKKQSRDGGGDQQNRVNNLTAELRAVQSERADLDKALESADAQYTAVEERVEATSRDEQKRRSKVASTDGEVKLLDRKLDAVRRKMEEMAIARQQIMSISDAGTDIENKSEKELRRELQSLTQKLHSFKNINRKAADQFSGFVDEQEKLMENRKKLSASANAIYNLIDTLDLQKDDTLLATFENVNKEFSSTFTKLVPTGKAKLVMKKLPAAELERIHADQQARLQSALADLDADDNEMHQDDQGNNNLDINNENRFGAGTTANDAASRDDTRKRNKEDKAQKRKRLEWELRVKNAGSMEAFVGVSIKASFTGQDTNYHTLQQLSGGQKAIVALALILAIQRCDPAPFYLFDEVDAALDDQYRGALASLIQAASKEGTQFVMTSFRRELIEAADILFHVTSAERRSHVQSVNVSTALKVIEEQQLEVAS